MSLPLPAASPSPLRLPDVPLNELPEATKDFLIAASATRGKPMKEIIRDVLQRAAADHGFPLTDTP